MTATGRAVTSRRGGHSFSWFLIGLLTGVAATLVLLLYLGGRQDREEAPAPVRVAVATPAAAAPPPAAPHKAQHPPARVAEAEPPPPPPTPEQAEQQVADDAAAAGMTSRSHDPDGQ